jgi:hydroxymethylbilane synthase
VNARIPTVGTRGSALALWQTRHVRELMGVPTREEIITTRGDVDMSTKLVGQLEKGLFTSELEAALKSGRIDFAVHSLKDVPTQRPDGLTFGAILPRATPCDRLLVRPDAYVKDAPGLPLKKGARVGACSTRRAALLGHFAPHVESVPLRGNVPTRLEAVKSGRFDAILLAGAGLARLGLDTTGLHVFELDAKAWPPAPGQGAVAVECRSDDEALKDALARLHDAATARAVAWERALLRTLEGGCATPFAAWDDGQKTHLGLSTPRGWVSLHLASPAGTTTPADAQRALDELNSQQVTHEPLELRNL